MAASGEPLLPGTEEVVLRPFRPEDDEGCKDLERKAPMIPPKLTWVVNGCTIHRQAFDYKVKQFPDGFIVVAESPSMGIVGMICAAVKTVSLHFESAPVKAVYVFDLRVAVSHQKFGLGKRLMEAVHRGALERGVKYAYLTVNGDNQKAQKLFGKMGYKVCSERFPVGSQLKQEGEEGVGPLPDGCRLKRLEGDAAAKILKEQLSEQDFLPGDVHTLTKSPFFLGTVVAHNGPPGADGSAAESFASVSIWDGSSVTSFWVSKFFFPAEWYGRAAFRALLLLTGAMLSGLWLFHIGRLYSDGYHGWASFYMLPTAAFAFGLHKSRKILGFIWLVMQNKDGTMKHRGRIFGLVKRGPQGEDLLRAVIDRAKSELARFGFLAFICNIDRDHPDRGLFGASGNFVAKLMHRSLEGEDRDMPRTKPLDFHDPRDI